MPHISIIVPVYNVDRYLRRCIDSILNQTFKDFELILINDGSTDSSQQICEEYMLLHSSKIKLVNQENKGLSAARNSGLKVSSGHFIAFVDSDDFIDLEYLDVLYNSITKSESEIAICGYMNYSGELKVGYNFSDTTVCSPEFFFKKLLQHQALTSSWGKLFMRTIISDLVFIEGRIMEDMFIWPLLLPRTKKIILIDKALYYYNRLGYSITRSEFNFKKLDMIDALAEWRNFSARVYPSLLDEALALYINTLFHFCETLYQEKSEMAKEKYIKYSKILKGYSVSIFRNEYISNKVRFKLILLNIGLTPLYFKLNSIRRLIYGNK
jgi:glycosyltransferase involved in cell wall biosynthesis